MALENPIYNASYRTYNLRGLFQLDPLIATIFSTWGQAQILLEQIQKTLSFTICI